MEIFDSRIRIHGPDAEGIDFPFSNFKSIWRGYYTTVKSRKTSDLNRSCDSGSPHYEKNRMKSKINKTCHSFRGQKLTVATVKGSSAVPLSKPPRCGGQSSMLSSIPKSPTGPRTRSPSPLLSPSHPFILFPCAASRLPN